jgi:hypothetical protein
MTMSKRRSYGAREQVRDRNGQRWQHNTAFGTWRMVERVGNVGVSDDERVYSYQMLERKFGPLTKIRPDQALLEAALHVLNDYQTYRSWFKGDDTSVNEHVTGTFAQRQVAWRSLDDLEKAVQAFDGR